MTLLAAVGHARALDGREAGMQATHQALNELGNEPPAFGLVMASYQYDAQQVVNGIASLTGNMPLAGLEGARPALALVLADVAWQILHEAQPGADAAAVREAFGADIPIAGGYTLGQIVPGGEGSPQFLNQHMVVVFGEPEETGK